MDVVALTSPRAKLISGPKNSRSSAKIDFFTIGTFPTAFVLEDVRSWGEVEIICSLRVFRILTQTGHIELSKAVSLAHTWGCRGMGCAFGFALLLPFFFDGAAHYQFLNFFPIRLIAISFKPLVA